MFAQALDVASVIVGLAGLDDAADDFEPFVCEFAQCGRVGVASFSAEVIEGFGPWAEPCAAEGKQV